MTSREKELEFLLRKLAPATIDVLWCALVWNDHNCSHADLYRRLNSAAKALGYERGADVEVEINPLIERINRALGERE